MSKLWFFDIFLDILHNLKKSLGQEHIKGGLIFPGQTFEQFSLLSLEK